MLRLSLINSSQLSLSLHNIINIKSLETSRYGGWLRFHLKKATNWHRPWIDSGQSYLFIYQLIRPSVRSFARSFPYFLRSLTHSLVVLSCLPACIRTFCHVCMFSFMYLFTKECHVQLPVQRKRFVSMAVFEIQ